MKLGTILFIAFACADTFASDPGQPLDCSDWVMVKSGITCHTVLSYPCEYSGDGSDNWCRAIQSTFIDNDGFLLGVKSGASTQAFCGSLEVTLGRHEVRRFNGVAEELIAYLPERCGAGSSRDWGALSIKSFDEQHGYIYIVATAGGDSVAPYPYEQGYSLIRLEGFTTESEVLQTFTPPLNVSFRVPIRPEGMAAADHFDTYWGNLAHPIDFTQAHPLQCGYPAAPPHVGDYLTVADTVPTPAPGQGVYYVTAATYQGATRYGRKAMGGQLSGRDPALLPVCVQP